MASGSTYGESLGASVLNVMDPNFNGRTTENVADVSKVEMPQKKPISNEEFENLILSVYLLRISQLRYIVTKFAINASGNKTKLLQLIVQEFYRLRNDPVLHEINKEMVELITKQDELFSTPAIPNKVLEEGSISSNFLPMDIFNVRYNNDNILLGPYLARPGRSTGRYSFVSPEVRGRFAIVFSFPQGKFLPFSIEMEFNGCPLEINNSDFVPSPIDITDILEPPGNENIFVVKIIHCSSNVQILIQEYCQIGIDELMRNICPGISDVSDEILVRSRLCSHSETFTLGPYLSAALATGNWKCPICGCDAYHEQIVAVGQVNQFFDQGDIFMNDDISFDIDLFS